MPTTRDIPSMGDMYQIVAVAMPKLREPCYKCNGFIQTDSTTHQPCYVCNAVGWLPTKNLQNIIINIEYNYTLVLQHDMIGWMAKVTLDDEATHWLDNERPVYGDPVTAVYAALYRSITKSSRIPVNTPDKQALYTNLDVSR